MAQFERARLATPSGADLAIYTATATAEPRAIVQINHGLAECADRYEPFALFLAARGYHVIAQDHRGHGYTEASDGAPRRFADKDGWTKLMSDVAAVQDHGRALWGDLPMIVFGHSMGAVIAMNHVMRAPEGLAGAAIWNGNMAMGGMKSLMRLVLFFEALVGGPFTPSHTIDNLSFKGWNKRFPEYEGKESSTSLWLSRDMEQVRIYDDNPVCGWPSSVSLWRDFLDGIGFAEDNRNLKPIARTLPFNLIGGGQDPATEGGKTVRHLYRRLKRARFKDLTFQIHAEDRHETLMELEREARMQDFADWLDRITG